VQSESQKIQMCLISSVTEANNAAKYTCNNRSYYFAPKQVWDQQHAGMKVLVIYVHHEYVNSSSFRPIIYFRRNMQV
jgi:hypothetical protein